METLEIDGISGDFGHFSHPENRPHGECKTEDPMTLITARISEISHKVSLAAIQPRSSALPKTG